MSTQNVTAPASSSSPNPAELPGDRTPLTFDEVQAAENAQLGGSGPRSALCISGGGIRSATFALGALQGLADLEILQNFDYLSTVSGGGYIGSWLTAWKERQNGIKNVVPKLKSSAAFPPKGDPDPVQHLREYNNYLSPRLGLFSADTWTLVATVARNMLLNWLVFVPLLMFALMLPRILLSLARVGEAYASLYPPRIVHLIDFIGDYQVFPILGGLLFAICIFNVLRYLPSIGNKDHSEGDFLKFCLAPLLLATVAVLSMESWFTAGDASIDLLPKLSFMEWFRGIALSGFAGWLAYLLTHKDIWRKWKHIAGLTVAILLTALSLSWAAWLLSWYSSSMGWPIYISVGLPMFLLAFASAVTLFVGLTSLMLEDEDREWLSRAGAWVLLSVLSWAAFCSLVLLAPKYLFMLHGKLAAWVDSAIAAAGGIGGVVAALAGLSSKTKAQKDDENNKSSAGGGALLGLAGKLAAPVFIVVFLTSLVILTNLILGKTGRVIGNLRDPGSLTDWKNHTTLLQNTRIQDAVILAAVFLLFSFIMARYININKFSLQAMYRSRLIRAYLGASNEDSHTNPFTGFADNDNIFMGKLTPTLKPFHVVNVTLNLVSGERLAWQQRKAESFTVSPLHCGYGDHYRPSIRYADGKGLLPGISLGTAVAISGAAASPNMGYHSSPAMTFIMTLFNARLGAWLGNPKQRKWRDEGPRTAFDSIVREALGLTNDTSPYVYLSDGGHFENLALYEMVRRRCRYIIVLDGGADPGYNYEDLGNALRKIRIDQKIAIEFETPFLVPLSKPQDRCAIARICYKNVDPSLENGYLIYIKPAVLGSEPPDVTSYKAANADFPHQSTADQWFDESQTESYRMLGLGSVIEIFNAWDKSRGFDALLENARAYLRRGPRAAGAAAGK